MRDHIKIPTKNIPTKTINSIEFIKISRSFSLESPLYKSRNIFTAIMNKALAYGAAI